MDTPNLDTLRQEIDAIDGDLHGLIRRRATLVVHLRDEQAKSGLLVGAALQDDLHAVKQHAVRRGATVICGVGKRTDGMRERDPLAFVDGADDADGGRDALCH